MDLTILTLSVLVKIDRSNSSGDGFYTIHQCPSIGLTSVQPDSITVRTHLTQGVLNPTDQGRRAVGVGLPVN